ncbi:hypothetical protein ADN00_12995 [Ornatilinea apprima]|uniref:CRISPR type III-associated protein domain-containing protein n=1 Tax=Ornatilinea apprima TaxID=1134406 RepID=A0A0P6XS35_9CHLR|nr:RAMP superfamily CRISPR-associated protein [Ornatilinea apprima]KPL75302.1 hypothetical protein ADN00_12995 [Ornatilinea apprima]
MRKLLLNEFVLGLELKIIEDDLLLIGMPDPTQQKKKEDKADKYIPMRSSDGKYFIPGSSLKGVLRSRAEYIANIIHQGNGVCHIFDQRKKSEAHLPGRLCCGDRFEIRLKDAEKNQKTLPYATFYADACPACQLFGHSSFQGRLSVTDFPALDSDSGKPFSQTHIAVDRLTAGAAQSKLFTPKYLRDAVFKGSIHIQNFSIWQLGWLGFVLQDLREGLIRLGRKQTSGYGKLAIQKETVRFRYLGKPPTEEKLWGIGKYLNDEWIKQYGYGNGLAYESIDLPGAQWSTPDHLWYEYSAEAPPEPLPLWENARSAAYHYLQSFKFTPDMQLKSLQELWDRQREAAR